MAVGGRGRREELGTVGGGRKNEGRGNIVRFYDELQINKH
jgi:hypothetical protein